MALDSIAKLAVIITGDETPLVRATKRGADAVAQFEQRTMSSYGRLVTKNLFKATAAALFDGLRRGGESIMAYEKRVSDLGERYDELRKKQGTFVDASVKGTDTLTAKFTLLNQNISDGFAAALSHAVPLIDLLNKQFDDPSKVGIHQQRAMRARLAEQEAAIGRAEEAFKRSEKRKEELRKMQDDLAESAEDARRRAMDDLASRAAQIEESLRTPQEAFRATIAELDLLLSKGLLFGETYQRAVNAAKEKLDEATKGREAMQERFSPRSFGAVDRFSTAGYSAMVQAGLATQNANQQAKAEMETARNTKQIANEQERFHADLLRFVKSLPGVGITDLN